MISGILKIHSDNDTNAEKGHEGKSELAEQNYPVLPKTFYKL